MYFCLGLSQPWGGEQLQFALSQYGAVNLRVFRVMQAQAHIGFVQQQAPDDLSGRLARQVARSVLETPAQ